ncbi:hypothetical protein VHUM_01185 [Vanrija humicola]|uniref:Tc1-like transposase DDE domain-containing protein n=1 Tax=Vanrija humicola TaxID=5417 RepID=A0A7D8V0C6_VANHU|nr:hypothetical protein VHUM_01185 [Vanrija humicola]
MKTKKASGRPPKLSSTHSGEISKIISQNRRLSLDQLRLKCATVAPKVSLKTFRLFLHGDGYKRYIALRKPLLGPRERRLRRRWHRLTRQVNMDAVIFTDEAQVCIGKQGRIYVTCKANERLQPACLAPKIRKSPGIFVWAGIWYNGRTPLIRLDLSQSESKRKGFNSELYKQQVIRPHLGPAFKRLNNNWRAHGGAWVMEDGSRIHFKPICRAEKGRWNMRCLYHPPNSPDLNPIEHAWAELKRLIALEQPPPHNIEELWEVAQRVWQAMPTEFFNKLIETMRLRRRDVRKNLGGATRF